MMPCRPYDDDEIPLRPAFPISYCTPDASKYPPTTAFEYIQWVRSESQACPATVVSTKDFSAYQSRQNVMYDDFNGFIRALSPFRPPPRWQKSVLKAFSQLHENLFNNRDQLQRRFPKSPFPKTQNEEKLCLFCLGYDLFKKIYCSAPSDASDNEVVNRRHNEVPPTGKLPLLSYVLYLKQAKVEMLLSFFKDWMEEIGFNRHIGKWLYALLICLDKPLNPDTCAILRDICRLCAIFRNGLKDPRDKALAPLNVIITLIVYYFDQKDMVDTDNEDLNSFLRQI